jgi:hypothetical protein
MGLFENTCSPSKKRPCCTYPGLEPIRDHVLSSSRTCISSPPWHHEETTTVESPTQKVTYVIRGSCKTKRTRVVFNESPQQTQPRHVPGWVKTIRSLTLLSPGTNPTIYPSFFGPVWGKMFWDIFPRDMFFFPFCIPRLHEQGSSRSCGGFVKWTSP